ncbi:MAG: hypothetical protein WBE20_00590, partial [Candidatus Acidiferrales bacterium]
DLESRYRTRPVISNRHSPELEIGVSYRKQKTEAILIATNGAYFVLLVWRLLEPSFAYATSVAENANSLLLSATQR